MRQTLHILRKDLRYLWREICLVLALDAMFIWIETHSPDPWWAEMLLTVAAGYLVARLIHAEAIPGDRQFWITRPYRWKSLLGAKLLFVLVFVNLPILIAQLLILMVSGFSPVSNLPGLLWSQVLMIIVVSIPIAALAAVTSGIVAFIFPALILLAIGFGSLEMIWFLQLRRVLDWPVQVGWVRDSVAVVLLVATALSVLYIQYGKRGTLLSRSLALGGAALAVAVYVYMPWSLAFAVQSQLSKQPFDGSSLQIALDPNVMKFLPRPMLKHVEVDLSIAVSRVPDDVDLEADALAVSFQAANGRTWKSGGYDLSTSNKNSRGRGVIIVHGAGLMDLAFFNEERAEPLNVQGSLYLTVFGNPQSRTVLLRETPTNVMDGLQCYTDIFGEVLCRSAFRWPGRMVDVKVGGTDTKSFTRFISYSPFPADIHFNPVETGRALVSTVSSREVTFTAKEPLTHFRLDFQVRGVKLAESAAAAQ